MSAAKSKRLEVSSLKVGKLVFPVWKLGDGRFAFDYRDGTKRRIIARTKFADLQTAAADIAVKLLNGETEALQLSPQDCRIYVAARDAIEPFGIALDSLARDAAEAFRVAGAGVSLAQLARAYSQSPGSTPAPSTAAIVAELLIEIGDKYDAAEQKSLKHLDGLRWDLEKFAVAFPDLTVAAEKDIRAYLRDLTTRPNKKGETRKVGLRRRDNVRNAIAQLSRFARKNKYLPEDKISPAEKIKRVSHGGDITTYTADQLATFIEHVPHEWRPWMAIAAFAGLRTSEIFRLDWRAIKWDAGAIAVPRAVARKVRTARMAPLLPILAQWLKPWRDARGPMFTAKSWTALESRHKRALAKIKLATGLKWEKNALRHSFGSHRLALVKSIEQVALEMGNSPAKVRENYHDPKTEDEGKAYFEIKPPEAADNIIPLALQFRA